MFKKVDRIYDEYDFVKLVLDGSIVAKDINNRTVFHKYIYNRETMMYTIFLYMEGRWCYEYKEVDIGYVLSEINNDFDLFDGWVYTEIGE